MQLTFYRKSLSHTERHHFFWHLESLLSANVPLMTAVELMKTTFTHKHIQSLLLQMTQTLSTGRSLAVALQQFPQSFSSFHCYFLNLGEQQSALIPVLKLLAQHAKQREQLQQGLQKALAYPCLLLITSLGLFLFILLKALPQMENLLNSRSMALHSKLQKLFALSHVFTQHGFSILILIIIFLTGFITISHHPKFKRLLLGCLMKLPLCQRWIQQQYALVLVESLKVNNHVHGDLISVLTLVAHTTQNPIIQTALTQSATWVKQGLYLGEALQKTSVYPQLMTRLIQSAEQSGTLGCTLDYLCQYYYYSLNQSIQRGLAAIVPISLIMTTVLILIMVVCFYSPIFALADVSFI